MTLAPRRLLALACAAALLSIVLGGAVCAASDPPPAGAHADAQRRPAPAAPVHDDEGIGGSAPMTLLSWSLVFQSAVLALVGKTYLMVRAHDVTLARLDERLSRVRRDVDVLRCQGDDRPSTLGDGD